MIDPTHKPKIAKVILEAGKFTCEESADRRTDTYTAKPGGGGVTLYHVWPPAETWHTQQHAMSEGERVVVTDHGGGFVAVKLKAPVPV